MYSCRLSFFPKNIYLNMDFSKIKVDFKMNFNNAEDFGSIIVSNTDDFIVSVNDLGKIQIHYDSLNRNQIDQIINTVENSIKKYNKDFSLDRPEVFH